MHTYVKYIRTAIHMYIQSYIHTYIRIHTANKYIGLVYINTKFNFSLATLLLRNELIYFLSYFLKGETHN